jgi:hypothetical protein
LDDAVAEAEQHFNAVERLSGDTMYTTLTTRSLLHIADKG